MTVTTTPRFVRYTATGTQGTTYAVPFQFYELAVYADKVLKTNGVDYTVTGGNGSTGSVQFITGHVPVAGVNIDIDGAQMIQQPTIYTNFDDAPGQVYEKSVDQLTMMVRELFERAVKVHPASIATMDPGLPYPVANALIAWNPTATGFVNVIPATIGAALFPAGGSTDNALARFDGTTGIALQNSGVINADNAGLSIAATATPYNNDPLPANSGYFGDYKGLAANLFTLTQAEVQAGESGGIRDAITVWHYDDDGTDYQALAYRTLSDGIRSGVFGRYASGTPQTIYKDLHGVIAVAIGRVEWNLRGVSSFLGDSIQYGTGVCGVEYGAWNPLASPSQSGHLWGVLITLNSKKGAADGTHFVRGLEVINAGKLVSNALEAFTSGTDGDNGQYIHWLKGDLCTVTTGGIVMPASASGDVGTYIVYDSGDYSSFNRSGNAFIWTIGSTNRMQMDAGTLFPSANDGLALGTASLSWADLFLASGAVVDFANGDMTLTHSTDLLTFAGGKVRVDAGSVTAAGELGGFRVTGSTAAMRLIFGVDNTGTMISYIQSVEGGTSARELQLQPLGGAGVRIGSGGLRIDITPTGVTGAGPINIGSGSTINSRVPINWNGTQYWIPASTTAF